MIPEATEQTGQRQQGRRGQKGRNQQNDQQARPGLPYIKNIDLSQDKTLVKVLDVRVQEEGRNQYSDIVLKLAFRGRQLLWGLRTSNPNFRTLRNAWGGNENDWVNKEFYIFLEEDDFDHKFWQRVDLNVSGKKEKK